MSLKALKAGDTVLIKKPRQDIREETITKVGRKYLYVGDGWNERGYDRENGYSRSGNGEWNGAAYTPEMWQDHRDRIALNKEIRDLGIRFEYLSFRSLSNDQVRRIIAILKEGPE